MANLATLFATILGFAFSTLTTWFRDRRQASIDAARDIREDTKDQSNVLETRRSRRYADQRAAYVDFAQACNRAEWRRLDFEQQHGPDADPTSLGFTGPLREVLDALTLVQLLGARDVADAAQLFSDTLHRLVFHRGSPLEHIAAANKYRAAMRADLQVDGT